MSGGDSPFYPNDPQRNMSGQGFPYGAGNPNYSQSQQPRAQPQRYQFTQDEIRVLKECNRESFWGRSMPLGTALALGTMYAVRVGYLKGSPRFGPGPKMFAAAAVGYFIGKFSYQTTCMDKILALENSPLAEMIKARKGKIGLQETLATTIEPGFNPPTPIVGTTAFPEDKFSDTDDVQSRFTEISESRPLLSFDNEATVYSGGDVRTSFDQTEQMLSDRNLPERRPVASTTYEDLRRQNREEYRMKSLGSGPSGIDDRRSVPPPPPSQPVAESPSQSSRVRNIYGDIWDDKPK